MKSPLARAFLRCFIAIGQVTKAAKTAGCSPSSVYKWRDTDPVFLEIHNRFWKEVIARWQAVAEHKALKGFEDLLYDAEGNLKGRRVREDSSFLRAFLASIDPEHWGSRTERDSNITVVIVDVEE